MINKTAKIKCCNIFACQALIPVLYTLQLGNRIQLTGSWFYSNDDESAEKHSQWLEKPLTNYQKVFFDCFKMSSRFIEDRRFILLVQKNGKKRERTLLKSGSSKVDVLPGTLLRLLYSEDPHLFIFETFDQENIEVECRSTDEFEAVTPDEFQLLFSVPTCNDRLVVFHNKAWIEEGIQLKVGDLVEVQMKGYDNDLLGVLKFKGKVTDIEGIYFGIELVVMSYFGPKMYMYSPHAAHPLSFIEFMLQTK